MYIFLCACTYINLHIHIYIYIYMLNSPTRCRRVQSHTAQALLYVCVRVYIHIHKCPATGHIALFSHMNETCHIPRHIWMRYVTYHVTYEWDMSHTTSHMNETCHKWMWHVSFICDVVCDMSHSYVTRCNTLQHATTCYKTPARVPRQGHVVLFSTHCNTLQHTATRYHTTACII